VGIKIPAATMNALVLTEGAGVVAAVSSADALLNYTFATVPDLKITTSVLAADATTYVGDNQTFPICKVFNDRLYFFNGVMANKAQKVHLIPDNNLRPELDAINTPYAIVDPVAGAGDYQTIQAALTAVGATGGTIYVQPGMYLEALTLPAGCKDLTVIGAHPQTTSIYQVGAGSAVLTVAADVQHNMRWVNLSFSHETAANYVIDSTTGTSRTALNVFENCSFTRAVNPGAVAMVRLHGASLRFINCTFSGVNSHNDIAIEWERQANPFDLFVEHCWFDTCKQIILGSDHVGAGYIGKLVFVDNYITSCNYQNGAVGLSLIELASPSVYQLDTVFIARNYWQNSGNADQVGSFCDVVALTGSICDNGLHRPTASTPAAAPRYIIMVAPSVATADVITVTGNRINAGFDGAIYAPSSALICGNRISNFASTNTAVYAVFAGPNCFVEDNIIDVTSGTAAVCIISVEAGAGYEAAHVTNNNISNLQNLQMGVVVANDTTIISGNHIRGINAGATCEGIHVNAGADHCVIRGNHISRCKYGVKVLATSCIADNNILYVNAAASNAGIYLSGADYTTISGNRITGGDASEYGIYASASRYSSITGNNVSACTTGIYLTGVSSYAQCTGNRIQGATTGISLVDVIRYNIASNHIMCKASVAAVGIDAHQTGATPVYGSICNNLLEQQTGAGSSAFLLGNVQFCGVSNNTLMDTVGAAGWAAHGLPAGGTAIGAGPNFGTAADAANNFDT
jgi:hypothetical protein